MTELDTETWLPVAGYEGLYEVSDLGRVRSLDTRVRTYQGTRARKGRILNFKPRPDGYRTVSLSRDSKVADFLVHRLVAAAFLPNPTGTREINHVDFDRANNRASNLEWCSTRENRAHSKRAGRIRNGTTKLTPGNVREIRARIAAGHRHIDIAADYGVGANVVGRIKSGQRWASLA